MGLVKAALGAASGVMGDQWKEYFTCSALPADVLAVKGEKKQSGRSANRHGSENIITDGSIVAVAEGQCALIVEQGKVVDLCAEPGEYTYNTGTQPSLLSGGLAKNIDDAFAEMGKRFAFGGQEATDQRIYYINTKELPGNKYGTPSPVPFRVVDQRAGIDMDISIRCFGEYSYRITNPILFYTNVCGNVENAYLRETLDSQLKTELLTALQPAFAKISEQGIRYSALPGHTMEMADALNEVLSAKWKNLRGIEIVSLGVSGVKASEEDEAMLKAMQRDAAYMDPTRGPSCGCPGRRHAGRCRQHQRGPGHGLYGRERGCRCGRSGRSDALPDGGPAGGGTARSGSRRGLELCLRPERQHGQILHGLWCSQAGGTHGLGVQLRHQEQRQVLLRVRQTPPGGPVRQLRLEACRPHPAAQVLPGMRQALWGIRGA